MTRFELFREVAARLRDNLDAALAKKACQIQTAQIFVDELPRNAMGKVQKNVLRFGEVFAG